MGKLALIGLDGMSWTVLLSHSEHFNGILKLVSQGVRGICWCIPPYTVPSWMSISTGVSTTKLNLWSFSRPEKTNDKLHYRLTTSLDVKYPRLSELLSLNKLSSVVINHVLSYPPHGWLLKKCVLVSDETSPKEFVMPKYSWFLSYVKNSIYASRLNDNWVPKLADRTCRFGEGVLKLIDEVSPDFL